MRYFLVDEALGVQGFGHLATGLEFQKELKDVPHQGGLTAVDGVLLVHDVQAQHRLPADVFAQTCRREVLVADPFADDLVFTCGNDSKILSVDAPSMSSC